MRCSRLAHIRAAYTEDIVASGKEPAFPLTRAFQLTMMSQNHQAAKDRLQAQLDLQTDLKAEILIGEVHGSVETFRLQQWTELLDIQQHQIELLQGMLERLEVQRATG